MTYSNDSFFQRTKNYWPAALVFILINLVSIAVLWRMHDLQESHQTADNFAQAEDLQMRFSIRFDSLVNAAQSLTSRVLVNGKVSRELFEKESEYIRSYFEGFQAINYINPQGVIEMVTPYEQNISALGRDLNEHPILAPLIQSEKIRQQIQLSPPIELYQGGKGMAFYQPLIVEGEFIGWLNIVFRISDSMRGLFLAEEVSIYNMILKDKESQLTIYADESWTKNNGQNLEDYRFYPFPFYGRTWEVGLLDSRVSVVSAFSRTSFFLVLFLSGLLAVLVKLYLDRVDQISLSLNDALTETMLLRVLCHDLGSPLTMANFLVDKLERHSDDSGQESIKELRESLKIQSDMLDNIRELQLYKKGSKQMSLVPVSLNAAFFQAKRVFAKKLDEKQIELVANFDSQREWKILGHKVCFENNIFNNLISNALKYSERGAKVVISFKDTDEGVVIEIRDQGIGMSQASMKSFEKGEALPSLSGTEGESGSGFGLVLVKSFVELTRGKIKIIAHDKGTSFVLTYPGA